MAREARKEYFFFSLCYLNDAKRHSSRSVAANIISISSDEIYKLVKVKRTSSLTADVKAST